MLRSLPRDTVTAPTLPEIIVINLDIVKTDPKYKEYAFLATSVKIVTICQRIRDLCAHLKIKKPNALWILSWRENGLFGGFPEHGIAPDLTIPGINVRPLHSEPRLECISHHERSYLKKHCSKYQQNFLT